MNLQSNLPDFGRWILDREKRTATLVPDRAPFWALLDRLEANAVDTDDDEPLTTWEEAVALVAVCFRYGNYLRLLTWGNPFAGFLHDPGLSRISNPEMHRINVEASAAVAEWLRRRDETPRDYYRLVRTARFWLRSPWLRGVRPVRETPNLIHRMRTRYEEMVTTLQFDPADCAAEVSHRQEANAFVNTVLRNGPIEDLHAGASSEGLLPGYRRLWPKEIHRVMRHAVKETASLLILRRHFPEAYSLLVQAPFFSPVGWTTTEDTCPVLFRFPPHIDVETWMERIGKKDDLPAGPAWPVQMEQRL